MNQQDAVQLLDTITGLTDDSESAPGQAAIYIESVCEGPPKNTRYSYEDFLSEFKRDLEVLGLEKQVEWDQSEGFIKVTMLRIVAAFARQIDGRSNTDYRNQNSSKLTISLPNLSFGSHFLDVLSSLSVYTAQESITMKEIIQVDFSAAFLSFSLEDMITGLGWSNP